MKKLSCLVFLAALGCGGSDSTDAAVDAAVDAQHEAADQVADVAAPDGGAADAADAPGN